MMIQNAQYIQSSMDSYIGNPLIEALPDYLCYTTSDIQEALTKEPKAIDADANRRQRAVWLQKLNTDLFIPSGRHIQLMEMVDMMILNSYDQRNPNRNRDAYLSEAYARQQRGEQIIVNYGERFKRPITLTVFGCPGVGKSLAVKRILSLYPQVLRHSTKILDHDQIVYLKVDCPDDGNVKSLCYNIISEVDRVTGLQYMSRYGQPRNTLEALKRAVIHLVGIHHLGILVIDEIQNLVYHKGNKEVLLGFFVSLLNSIHVPVLFVGRPQILRFIQTNMSVARRFASFGSYRWTPLQKDSKEWTLFFSELTKNCVLHEKVKTKGKLAQELETAFYDESQGIPEVLVKLFVLSQLQCLVDGHAQLTAQTVRLVARRQLTKVEPLIDALRRGDKTKLKRYGDLRYGEEEFDSAFKSLIGKLD